MKIGIITHNYPATKKDRQNAGIFVYDIAHTIRKLGHDVFIFCPDINQRKEKDVIPITWFSWLGKEKKLGDLKLYNPYDIFLFINFFFSGLKTIKRFCQGNEIEFIIGMWSFPAGIFAYWAKKILGIKYCLWSLGSDIYVYARYPILRTLIKHTLSKADFLLSDGIDLAKRVRKLANKKCIFLPSASSMTVKKGKKINQGNIKFTFLGRMELVKGPDILLSGLEEIGDLDFQACFIGGGSLLLSLKNRVKNSQLKNRITFLGNINSADKIHEQLTKSDCLIIPSRSDSIPLVFSESMKTGTPVIVAEVGDMVKLVRQYKVGITFPKEDHKKLAGILRKIIMEGRQTLVDYQKNTQKVAGFFDITNSAKQLIMMIKQKNG